MDNMTEMQTPNYVQNVNSVPVTNNMQNPNYVQSANSAPIMNDMQNPNYIQNPNYAQPMPNMQPMNYIPMTRDIPKCNCCGNIGPWKVEPLFLGRHWIIAIILLFLGFIPGIFYLVTVAIIRSKEDSRAKICPKCNGRNLFTFLY